MIPSLEARALRGATWLVVGHLLSRVLQVANNLLIVRLISKEIIGTTGLAYTAMSVIAVFAELGIGLWIIQDEKGKDPEFLNTAWTMQVILGLVMWGVTCAIAYPCASFYTNPVFLWLLPVVGLSFVIGGFNSTALFTYYRELRFGKPIAIDVIAQVMNSIVAIGLALLYPSIWCLVLGLLVKTLTKMLLSHGWLDGIRHAFSLDRAIAQHLLRFGRWILGSSITVSIFYYLERLIVGRSMTLGYIPVYDAAISMIVMITGGAFLTSHLRVNRLLLSLYANLKGLPSPTFRARVRNIKIFLIGITLLGLATSIVYAFGLSYLPMLGNLGSTQDYSSLIGQWLPILALGIAISGATQVGPILLAFGDSRLDLKVRAIEKGLTVICLAVGGWKFGVLGLLWGKAIANFLYYPFIAHAYRRYSVWFPRLDFIGLIGVFGVAGLGWYLGHSFVTPLLGS